MILVDVEIPALDSTYDFELDEDVPVSELLERIVQLITDKTRRVKTGEGKQYLYAYYDETILDETLTLKEQGIGTGEKLILL